MMNEVTMNNITNDIATRLLAQENLLIHRAPVRTASFDVKNRILTLPQWKNMTTEIEEMLKAHEVGHALYTNEDALESIKDSGVPFGYVNILEDARIEKLMKRKYPGLRRIFNIGYRELNELDFFDMKRNANRKMLLIDRINLYFKVGYTAGIKFSVAEKYLVDQVERLESMDEVITLAKRIHAFTKQELEEEKRKRQNSQEYKKIQEEIEQEEQQYLDDMEELDDQYEDESMSGDDDWTSSSDDSDDDDDFEEKHEPNKGYGREDEEEQFGVTPDQQMSDDVPMTDRALDEKLRDLADVNTRYTYLTLPDTSKLEKTIIPYKKVLADAKLGVEAALQKATELSQNYNDPEILTQYHNRYAEHLANYEKFKSETTRVVNYLIKEFEMKKAATNYKRTQIAKTGVLDVRKLAFYKTREDLFKQVRIEKDGQRHGMIFLLDWSGSMCDVINETAKQLISLVFFCYRAKIPFQVFAFTDRRFITNHYNIKYTTILNFCQALIKSLVDIHICPNSVLHINLPIEPTTILLWVGRVVLTETTPNSYTETWLSRNAHLVRKRNCLTKISKTEGIISTVEVERKDVAVSTLSHYAASRTSCLRCSPMFLLRVWSLVSKLLKPWRHSVRLSIRTG